MKYHFKTHKEKTGYWAECIELKGCRSEGDSWEELLENLKDALDLYLSEPESSWIIFPAPRKIKKNRSLIEVKVDPNIAFSVQIRQIRIKRKLTQKGMMALLGIKTLSNYQRLENPEKANPELKTLVELQSHLPELKMMKIFG